MQTRLVKRVTATFSSLAIRNFRLYFIGQGVSRAGTWVQTIAQTWLVYQLTGSGTYIGLLTAVQFLPILLLGPLGGLLADRFAKRPTLYVTQSASMVLAFVLAALVLSNAVAVWMVFVIAGLSGLVKVVDTPARQIFIMEMVGRQHLVNAVTLNSVEVNMARIVGPAVGGGLIAGIGLGWCFMVDGLSYIVVLASLAMMHGSELHPAPLAAKARGQLRDGFRYVWHTPILRNVLLMMVVIGTLAYEFPVVLPILAEATFGTGAGGFSFLMAAMGLGAVIGGVITANRGKPNPRIIAVAALAFGASLLLTAISPNLIVAGLGMVLVGISSVSFTSVSNSILQLQSAPEMRGRVMALWTMAFLGSTPIGGPIIGYASQHASARVGLAIGGLSALAVGLYALRLRIAQRFRAIRQIIPEPLDR